MRVAAPKLALLGIASTLIAISSPCRANDALLRPDSVGLVDAAPLADREMAELRGTGLLAGVTQGLLGTLTPAGRAALANATPATLNALTGFLPTLLGALPTGNTVSAQIGSQPTVTLNGTGPQSLGCGAGLTCGPGISTSLSSSTNPSSASVSISFTLH
jgi:hypothetical protein